MVKADPGRYTLVLDILHAIPQEILEFMILAYERVAAAKVSRAVRDFHAALAEVLHAENGRRALGDEPIAIELDLSMIADLTNGEAASLRRTATALHERFGAAEPAVSGFYGAIVAVLGRRQMPAEDHRHLDRLN